MDESLADSEYWKSSFSSSRPKKPLDKSDIKAIVIYEFEKIQRKHFTLFKKLEEKFGSNERKINSELILSWIDISIGYLGLLKLNTENGAFANYEMHEVLIELFTYNYFILNFVMPSLDVSLEDDLQLISNLSATTDGFYNVPDFKEELKMAMDESEDIIATAIYGRSAPPINESQLSSTSLHKSEGLNNLNSMISSMHLGSSFTASKFYDAVKNNTLDTPRASTISKKDLFPPAEFQGSLKRVSIDDTDLSSIEYLTVDDLLILLHKHPTDVLIVDLRPFKSFIDSTIENGNNTINIDPSALKDVTDYQGLLYSLQVGNIDFHRALMNYNKYKYILFYSDDEHVTKEEIIFEHTLKKEINIRAQFLETDIKLLRLQGGYREWNKYYAQYSRSKNRKVSDTVALTENNESKFDNTDYDQEMFPESDSRVSRTSSPNRGSVKSPSPAAGKLSSSSPSMSPFYPYQPPVPEQRDYKLSGTVAAAPYALTSSAASVYTSLKNQQPLLPPPNTQPPTLSPSASTLQNSRASTVNSANNAYPPSVVPSQSTIYPPSVAYSYPPVQAPTTISRKVPLVRLHNYGSTCYVNSMIQCLFNMRSFRKLFIESNKFEPILRVPKEESLAAELHSLFVDFYRVEGSRTIRPNRFLGLCNRLKPEFRIPYEQQDTSQFLYFMLDKLHNELKIDDTPANRSNFATGDIETDPFSYFSSSPAYIKWNDSLLKSEGVSPINRFFQIQQETTLRCGRCGFNSVNYDYSSMMHLNLNGSEQFLDTLIKKNLEPEELSERLENAWKCPNCEKLDKEYNELRDKCTDTIELRSETTDHDTTQKRKSRSRFFKLATPKKEVQTRETVETHHFVNVDRLTVEENERYQELESVLAHESVSQKFTQFIKLPTILTIYLAKFDPYQRKINSSHLKFPIKLKFSLKRNGVEMTYEYELNSWIDHIGSTVSSGHYTAIAKKDEQWVYCDDERLSRIKYDEKLDINDASAYLLFYTLVSSSG